MGLCHFLEEIQHKQIHSQSQRDGSVIKSWLDREVIFCWENKTTYHSILQSLIEDENRESKLLYTCL